MADTQLSTNVYVLDNNFDTPQLIAWALDAITKMTTSIDTFFPGGRVDIAFLPAKQIGGGGGWGFTYPNNRLCTVNSELKTKAQIEYTVLHELSHVADPDMLNHAAKVTLAGLMSPAVTTSAGFWSAGSIHNAPAEAAANTFPQAFAGMSAVAGGFYTRTIASGSFGTYRTTYLGSAAPTAMTLAAAASAGDTVLKYSGATTGLTVGDYLLVGTGGHSEITQISVIGTSGSGGSGFTVSPAMTYNHASGATLVETSGQPGAGGTGGAGPTWNILIGGEDYTLRIPAETIQVTESGADAPSTMDFTIETLSGNRYFPTGDETSKEVIFTNLLTGWRIFGGFIVGATRRHLPGPGVAQDIRCMSYDAWLDRRYIANYWTTTTSTQSGLNLANDRLIVQDLVRRAVQGGGLGVALQAPDATVASTNAGLPKLNPGDGSLRSHILMIAENAASVQDPTVRRVYCDFFTRVHYYKGSEGTTAPYRIGDAMYASTVTSTANLVSYWPMSEGAGATCYDATGGHNVTLSGFYVRGIAAGVVNQPASTAIFLGGNGSGLASSAALHGNTFSLECWFQRNGTGAEQTLFDFGTADAAIEFQADDTLRVYKKGTGNDFTTTATYTDTNWHHLVITHSGSATHVYVDGNDKAGTAALKTLVPSTNNLYVGSLSDGTLKYNGSLQHVAFYSAVLSQNTVTAHYNDGVTLVPDDISQDIDFNNSAVQAYVKGTGVSGWVKGLVANSYGANVLIDRPDVNTAAKLAAVGTAYLERDGAPVKMVQFTVEGYDGWRAGQTVTFDDATLGVSGSYEIRNINTSSSPSGNGIFTYDITANAMPWVGHFDIKRKNRNTISGAQIA
jgi:hypothetical protein